MNRTQVVIPMAGAGSRFTEAGYVTPKPFLPLPDGSGNTLIEQVVEDVVEALGGPPERLVFLYRAEHTDWVCRSRLNRPDCSVTFIPVFGTTAGAAATVQMALPFLDPSEPVLVANSDQIFALANGGGLQIPSQAQQAAVCFRPVRDAKPERWSYLTPTGGVVEKPNKVPKDSLGTVGVYWWRRASYLQTGIENMVEVGDRTNGEYYLAPSLNYTGHRTWACMASVFIPLGTPADYESYIETCLALSRSRGEDQ